jgi:hypothetical protein
MALLAACLQVFKSLCVLSRVREMMNVIHLVHGASLTKPFTALFNFLLQHRPFSAAQIRGVLFFTFRHFLPVHHAFLQTTAIRPDVVRLVPASATSPRRMSSIRLGRCVLGFILSRRCISSSVSPSGVAARSSSTRRCMAFSVAGVSESAA